ncbi:hypothetical protein ACFLVE_02720 [Chloroflexota bacterium]
MESIGATLGKLGANIQGRPQKDVATCRCETCGQDFEGEITTYSVHGETKTFKDKECPACEGFPVNSSRIVRPPKYCFIHSVVSSFSFRIARDFLTT